MVDLGQKKVNSRSPFFILNQPIFSDFSLFKNPFYSYCFMYLNEEKCASSKNIDVLIIFIIYLFHHSISRLSLW
ncbi:MAG: hypothetical protein COZ75_02015 [Flavobacteriaceae bacterium CG_4_8_14_3_um_filter_34_10]|nr:MAG: hypothetical protein AUK33_06890 [Flavobacteriaceae bacterium CG2_30_34_30]PIV51310.1 MAG: hypothetical protein COS19_01890 [Flavobacteriaceae bacterium CG02_land_8_20_14_3_00_34_13]PIX10339.1 MAG: hypothetical protein COZ75_02015 [Flavobacteriaceae bacterium CG_4_8_14_3_um_filter_34_10]PJC07126.1 MAG: hypothetical protein CO068_07805 [Flavobacteriaceae bacterium CG_4_9_14_0_8_um_filter_34_30]